MMEQNGGETSSAERPTDGVDVAIRFLLNRMRFSKSGYGISDECISAIEKKLVARKSQPSHLAIVQAIHEMLWSSTESNFNEEHHTASLMGHLASNLSWCILHEYSARIMKGQTTKTLSGLYDIKWAAQSKTSEARTGGDFALALPGDDEHFKVILFQAKRAVEARAGSGEVNIYQFRSAKKPKPSQADSSSSAQESLPNAAPPMAQSERSADARLVRIMNDYRNLKQEIPTCGDGDACHQLESLLRAERLALEHAKGSKRYRFTPNRHFAYYVVWNRRRTVTHGNYFPHPPVAVTAASITERLLLAWKNDKIIDDSGLCAGRSLTEKEFHLVTNGADFAELFYCWTTTSSQGGMYIPQKAAENFIGDFAALCPGIDFLLLSDSESDSAGGKALENALKKAHYKVTTMMDRSALLAVTQNLLNARESLADSANAVKALETTPSPQTSRDKSSPVL